MLASCEWSCVHAHHECYEAGSGGAEPAESGEEVRHARVILHDADPAVLLIQLLDGLDLWRVHKVTAQERSEHTRRDDEYHAPPPQHRSKHVCARTMYEYAPKSYPTRAPPMHGKMMDMTRVHTRK